MDLSKQLALVMSLIVEAAMHLVHDDIIHGNLKLNDFEHLENKYCLGLMKL